METKRLVQVEALFHAALGRAPAERTAYLDQACVDDPTLREDVESLLRAHEDADRFLETPAGDLLPTQVPLLPRSDPPAGRIGAYRLIQAIGSGGMGAVYEAEQDNPRRKVALKLMRHGLTSRSALRRFEHESQILGRLHHPGIAQIYEAGAHGEGCNAVPYFAMEFIEGVDLIRHAFERKLTTHQRLELFLEVCDAVHYGHENGVIHRDLKPPNILVDAFGRPVVIDFGVARLTDSDIQQTTLLTDVGQLVGTIPYMSPEQLSGDPNDLDSRSDVYSLGVVCYQLLTGRLPHDLSNKPVPEAIRIIRSDDPTRPGSIDARLRGDLDTILGKALEKEKTRRYPTVADFAADLRRYLADQPVTARPPSALYQLRKFARRNRALAGGMLVAGLGLLIGMAAATWQAIEVTRQRNRAQAEALTATRINDYLQSILAFANPKLPSRDRSLRKVLDEAARRVDTELGADPEVEASIRRTIGMTYHGVGDLDQAELHLRKSWNLRRTQLTDDDVEEGYVLNDLVTVLRDKGEFAQAERLARDALPWIRDQLGDQTELRGCLLINLGETVFNVGDAESAMAYFHEGMDVLQEVRSEAADSLIVETMGTMAYILQGRGELDAAIDLGRRIVDLETGKYGENSAYAAGAMLYLSEYVRDRDGSQGLSNAESLIQRATTIFRTLGGDEDHNVAVCLSYLANIRNRQGRYDEAEDLYRRSVALRRRLLGDDHYETGKGVYNLALFLQGRNRLNEAESLLEELLAERRHTLAPGHPRLGEAVDGLADVYCANGRASDAETLLVQHHDTLAQRVGDRDPRTLRARMRLDEICPPGSAARGSADPDSAAHHAPSTSRDGSPQTASRRPD